MTSNSSQDPTDPTALVDDIIAELQTAFRTSVTNLKFAIAAYVRDRTLPPADAAAKGLFDYPAIRLTTTGEQREGQKGHNLSFGRFERAGVFETTVTRPDLFADYLRDQLMLLARHYDITLEVKHTGQQIPFPYVLAHAYLRDDHILDAVLPVAIPIPPIAEVQVALATAAETVSGATGADLKKRMRTGTVVTTDDRNWELRYTDSALRFSQSRAIGIDMESATIAAQGYRFRVPYGTLLCVSDKPLHGELKLPGQANRFYEEAIAAHLQIGIRACETMRDEGAKLHSRKLRAFNEPPFR